ncbi:hypothetical protein DHEL01_v209398 [Diaporthe helianthi]|uniref:Uncharacterized protein n=1 Tax=Diaporthe helianthi TaxID=158607 RepID=A0A2P5HPL0_DIAHE|nr:hypothetical protein DHEL01_v209398 [Diaporthe helianthi]
MVIHLFTTQSLFDGDILETLRQYIAGISIELPNLGEQWENFSEWLSQPRTAAAAFQSFMYGGFTPAGGLFATLTSMAMIGTLMPLVLVISSVIASLVAAEVWVSGVGR